MTVAIFGATGGIGSQAVRAALERNCRVRAYVRSPEKLTLRHENLEVFVGQVDDREAIRRTLAGCDAAVIALGISMRPGARDTASVTAHRHILAAMKELGVSRLVDWSTPSVRSPDDTPSFLTVAPGIMAGLFLPGAKKTLLTVSQMVQDSGLDWTIVRFMAPRDTPRRGAVKVSFGKTPLRFAVSRADIGAFLVEQLFSDAYLRRMPIIGS